MTERQALSLKIFSLLGMIKSSMSSSRSSSTRWHFFFCFCPASADGCGGAWLALVDTTGAARHVLFKVCRQCAAGVQCGSYLNDVQIFVCVSSLVRLLSGSKFSLRQSASTATKSLSSPRGKSKKIREQLCVHIVTYTEQPQESCT